MGIQSWPDMLVLSSPFTFMSSTAEAMLTHLQEYFQEWNGSTLDHVISAPQHDTLFSKWVWPTYTLATSCVLELMIHVFANIWSHQTSSFLPTYSYDLSSWSSLAFPKTIANPKFFNYLSQEETLPLLRCLELTFCCSQVKGSPGSGNRNVSVP